jgi:hypothetical protein
MAALRTPIFKRKTTVFATRSIGILLLGAWLVLQGLLSLVHFNFMGMDMVMGILALAAGILLLVGR